MNVIAIVQVHAAFAGCNSHYITIAAGILAAVFTLLILIAFDRLEKKLSRVLCFFIVEAKIIENRERIKESKGRSCVTAANREQDQEDVNLGKSSSAAITQSPFASLFYFSSSASSFSFFFFFFNNNRLRGVGKSSFSQSFIIFIKFLLLLRSYRPLFGVVINLTLYGYYF